MGNHPPISSEPARGRSPANDADCNAVRYDRRGREEVGEREGKEEGRSRSEPTRAGLDARKSIGTQQIKSSLPASYHFPSLDGREKKRREERKGFHPIER